jgi:pimeloyl-ACP methyl ester carboxylesterase
VHIRRWLSRIGALLAGLLGLFLLIGFTYEQVGRAKDASLLSARIGKAIDMGGRTLNLYCSGRGSPAVIFEAGGNAPGYSWTLVQPKIAEFTRACWYDRAGVGWSDAAPTPRTGASVVSDLHELLRRAGVFPPYVLVGASVGGHYVRIYTAYYPADVSGLVLVDSSHPDQNEPAFMLAPFNRLSPRRRQFLCMAVPAMARFGVLRFFASRMGGIGPSQFSPEQRDTFAKLDAQPKAFKAGFEQLCAATDGGKVVPTGGIGNPDLDNAARKAGSLGDRPLVVLTAGRYEAPRGLEKAAADFHEIWVGQLQADLARLSTRGRQVVVDAHHVIQDEAPEVVVAAVRQVVDEARLKK